MHTHHPSLSRRIARWVLPVVLTVAAFAVPTRALAASFAATTWSPGTQAVDQGNTFSVNIVMTVPAGGYNAYGIDAYGRFDPTQLQVVSITDGTGTPWTNPISGHTTGFDNTAGTLEYAAQGGTVSGTTVTAATVVFKAVGSGSASITFANVNEYIAAYGPYGVNGSATGASVTITPGAQLFFSDPLTGPSSPNLAPIPSGKYGYTASGLERTQSDNATDRPMVTTAQSAYLTLTNFVAEVTVTLPSSDLLFFGLGQGNADAGYDNEPSNAFYFRVHNNFQGYSGIQADVRTTSADPSSGYQAINQIGTYSSGSTITLRIARLGDSLTMSIVGGGSVTYNLSAYPGLGLTASNTRVFFGNTNVGSVFSDLKIYPMPAPVVTSDTVSGGYGSSFSYTISATNSPTSYAATGLPAGLTLSGNTISGTLPNSVGALTIGLSATNDGGTGTGTLTINVVDNIPPVITAPSTVTAEATSASGAAVTFTATANDSISGTVPVVATPASGSTFPLGISSVSLSATDAAGNIATQTLLVSVVDTTPPTLTVPANITAEATSASGAVVSFSATATDLVTASPAITYSVAPGSTFPLGATTVNVTATDAAGNVAKGSFTVTVVDTTPPAVTASLTPLRAGGDDESAQLFKVAFSATDLFGIKGSAQATLNGVAVTNGQIVKLQLTRSGAQRVESDDRVLHIRATSFLLTVTATDANGNVGTATAVPVFVKHGKDSEGKDGRKPGKNGDSKKSNDGKDS